MIAIRNGLLVIVVILSSRVLFADGKPWTMEAIMALKTISDPQISPDGSKVAYVVRSANFQRKSLRLTDLGCLDFGRNASTAQVVSCVGRPAALVQEREINWHSFHAGMVAHRFTSSQRQMGNPGS